MPETRDYQKASIALQEKREALIARMSVENTPDFMVRHARLLDDYFRESFQRSLVGPDMGIEKNPYAIIALGGYGRQEQCVHSDVDILFLFKRDIPKKAEALIREVIYPLWDIGMDIGHATRSLKDCISLGRRDFEVLTSLLDARFICGMSLLYSELMRLVRDKIVFRRANKIVDWLVRSAKERHGKFGNSAYLLEPNLKEGRGGLRDYHAMLWLARIKSNLTRSRDLIYQGYLSQNEYEELRQALSFIWHVRSRLHLLAGRKYDQLHFEYQEQAAAAMRYVSGECGSGVECFLRDLHSRMAVVKECHLVLLQEIGKTPKWFNFRNASIAGSPAPGLEIKRDALRFASTAEIMERPILLLKIFEESARLKTPLHPEAKRLVREFAFLVGDEIRASRPAVALFERILGFPSPSGLRVLEDIRQTGLLARLIPEFADVVDRIEYGAYHVFPVDRHLIETVEMLKSPEAHQDDDLRRTLYEEMPDRRPLLWAGLLHDIGKGHPGVGHSEEGARMVRTILARFGYSPAMIDTVSFLVREHLYLVATATRRDIEDEETILGCARRIREPERLRMLYLLSVADRMATGPKAWNDWTAVLVREFFLKTMNLLANGRLASANTVESARRKISEVLAAGADPDAKQLAAFMSPRYLLLTSTDEMQRHIRLYRSLRDRPFVWRVDASSQSDTRRITLCGKDDPEFFVKATGVFAVNRIQVLEAQIHKWRNHTVFFIFKVAPPPDPLFESERWERAERDLLTAMDGRLNLAEAVETAVSEQPPTRRFGGNAHSKVRIDNQGSRSFTIVEVFARDAPGRLYRIADALWRCRLDIWSAQIDTVGRQVADVFYVRDFDGRKITGAEMLRRIQDAIEAVLAPAERFSEARRIEA